MVIGGTALSGGRGSMLGTLLGVFVITLIVQLRSRRYNPVYYWTVILSTSMAGTTLSDFMNRDASSHYLAKGTTSLGWGPQGLGLGPLRGAARRAGARRQRFRFRAATKNVLRAFGGRANVVTLRVAVSRASGEG